MDATDLASQIAKMENELARLDSSFSRIEYWLFAATLLVVIGLVVEYWDEIRSLRAIRKRNKSGLDLPHHSHSFGAAFRAVVGGILVTVGVGWELVEEIQDYRVGVEQNDANARKRCNCRGRLVSAGL